MQPAILQKPEILLAGMSFYGDPFDTNNVWTEENHIGRTWKRLMDFLGRHGSDIRQRSKPDVFYEVHIYGPETDTMGLFEVFTGFPVERLEQVPVELCARVLPAGLYAVFTIEGEAIANDWTRQVEGWLKENGCETSQPFSAQVYDQRFMGLDRLAESSLDVYIPVRKTTA